MVHGLSHSAVTATPHNSLTHHLHEMHLLTAIAALSAVALVSAQDSVRSHVDVYLSFRAPAYSIDI